MIEIIKTADGSKTLKNSILDETYHSSFGAYTESMHVFLQEGLIHYCSHYPLVGKLKVLEIGFGTGLNALLTWEYAQQMGKSIFYETLEPYPISIENMEQMAYGTLSELPNATEAFKEMHRTSWNEISSIGEFFQLYKQSIKLEDFQAKEETVHAVYFDAFAPKTQPELWSVEALAHCHQALVIGGVLTTYCAQGQFKRNLRSLGFEVERVAGPKGGKREITRAWKV